MTRIFTMSKKSLLPLSSNCAICFKTYTILMRVRNPKATINNNVSATEQT